MSRPVSSRLKKAEPFFLFSTVKLSLVQKTTIINLQADGSFFWRPAQRHHPTFPLFTTRLVMFTLQTQWLNIYLDSIMIKKKKEKIKACWHSCHLQTEHHATHFSSNVTGSISDRYTLSGVLMFLTMGVVNPPQRVIKLKRTAGGKYDEQVSHRITSHSESSHTRTLLTSCGWQQKKKEKKYIFKNSQAQRFMRYKK